MLLLPLLFTSLLPRGPGLTATVDDAMSHGVVGDAYLSLDEAIRIANGTLLPGQLSAAEQARLSGTGTMLDSIFVDASITPTITLTAPLTDFTGVTGVHHHTEIMGVHANGAMPVIQGGNHARVFTLRTYNASLHHLRIVGGQVAVDALMLPGASPSSHMAEVMECELDGQTVAGVRVHGTGLCESMLMVMDCELHNMPVGFLLDDATAGGMVMVEGENLVMDGVTLGCRVIEGGAGGNMSMVNLFRSRFVNGTTLAELRRSPTSAQQFMFRIVHTSAVCSGNVVDVEGTAAGLTMFHHHHSDFVAGAGQKAFWVYPRTAEFDVHGSEMSFDGDVSIAANLASMRIWQQNNRYRNGTVTLDVDGALPNLLWNHYENCSLVVPVTARSPVVMRSCELVGTPVDGQSFLAPVTLLSCWRNGGTLTGFATETTPAPAPFLGTTNVSPADPQVGTTITFATDLPFGIGLVWDIALGVARPTTTAEPVRFYGDPANVIVLPAVMLFQSTMTVPLPNIPGLVGIEFYVQGVSVPLVGQTYAPAYHLPRGQRVSMQV